MLENRKTPVSLSPNMSSARPDASTVRHRARPTVASPARSSDPASADPEATVSIAKVVPMSAPVAVHDEGDGVALAAPRKDPEDDPQALYRYPFKDMRHLATVEDDNDPVVDVDPKNTTEPEGTTQLNRDPDDPAVPFAESEAVVAALPELQNPAFATQTSPPDGPEGDRFGGASRKDGRVRSVERLGKSGDYEVGYGRPPKETQFKKGRSGNPKGRPKDARNNTTIVTELLNTRLATKVNGQSKKLPSREIVFTKIMMKALTGDLKSLAFLLQFDQPDGPPASGAAPMVSVELSASERALLALTTANDLRERGLDETQIEAFLRLQGLDPDGDG